MLRLPCQLMFQTRSSSHARLTFSQEASDLAQKHSRIETHTLIRSAVGAQLMHPECRSRRRVAGPLHAGSIEQVDIPRIALETEHFREGLARCAIAIPLLRHARIDKASGLRSRSTRVVSRQHRKPHDKAAQSIVIWMVLKNRLDDALPLLTRIISLAEDPSRPRWKGQSDDGND